MKIVMFHGNIQKKLIAKYDNLKIVYNQDKKGYLMNKKNKELSEFSKALKNEKLKLTSQRAAIFEEVIYGEKHRECDEIFRCIGSIYQQ